MLLIADKVTGCNPCTGVIGDDDCMGTRIGEGTTMEASLSGECIIGNAGNRIGAARTIEESFIGGTWMVGTTWTAWFDADPFGSAAGRT